MTQILVGADAGGTKTSVVIGDGHAILGRAEGSPGAIRPGRALAAASAIADTIRRAFTDAKLQHQAEVMVVGAAGAGRENERLELERALKSERIVKRVLVTSDIEIALAAAFGKASGIVVSAGTGSIAIGRDAEGKLHRRGGYGWQMGDEGSGYAIGRAALSALSRAADGRGPLTTLSTRLLAAARVESFDELISWAVNANTAQVSSLAPAVLEAAADGDVVAQGIVDYAARELVQLARSLLPQFAGTATIQLALAGGILSVDRPLRTLINQRLAEEHRFSVIAGTIEPALGALHMAENLAQT